MSHTSEVKSLAVEIFYPPTSMEYGFEIVKQARIEQRVKPGSKDIVGSDRWLDQIMRFDVEVEAIERFWQNFNSQNSELSVTSSIQLFDQYLTRYLTTQFEFCLAENGCEKHLQLQPFYYFLVQTSGDYHIVTPNDITQFGDLSGKYLETNPHVGQGLLQLYRQLLKSPNTDFTSVIISPTEEYSNYLSQTDVINLWRTVSHDDGKVEAVGRYLLCNQVFTTSERRFLHNLIYLLNHQQLSVSHLSSMNREQLINLVTVDELLTDDPNRLFEPEYRQLIENPNSFNLDPLLQINPEQDIENLGILIDQLFQIRFNKSIINPSELVMYPAIKDIVNNYEPSLHQLLISQDKFEYYRLLRQMIYHCQAIWAKTKNHQLIEQSYLSFSDQPDSLSEEYYPWYNHLEMIICGAIAVGFEISTTMTDAFSYDNAVDYSLFSTAFNPLASLFGYPNFSQPKGYESLSKHNCERHGDYESEKCPKCHQSSD